MSRKRTSSLLFGVSALAVGIALYAAIDRPDSSVASGPSLQAAGQQAAVTDAVRDAVRSASRGLGMLSPNAVNEIRHLFTPADSDVPALFSVPAEDGGQCIASSVGVISSCLARGSSLPGTVTVADDSEGDDTPPYAYGFVRPNVRGVDVVVDGVRQAAALGDGFYVYKLASSANRNESVDAVIFKVAGDREITRTVFG